MSNKLAKNVKQPGTARYLLPKEAPRRQAMRQAAGIPQEKVPEKDGVLNNWKVVTGINLIIAVLFLCLALIRYFSGANMLNVLLLGIFGLLNMLCALWNLKRFGKSGS